MGRRLGQHFLQSPKVRDDILAAAALSQEEAVLETGPGQGALTGRLLGAAGRVTAVELDSGLCAGLRERWGAHPNFRLIEGDILAVRLEPEELFGQDEPYVVVSNLPYYLSTPFLFRAIAHRPALKRMVLMVQREIAERLVAAPEDGKRYGALSVAAHHAFHMDYLFTVLPSAFRPPPKVDSAVVAFRPRTPVLSPDEETRFLEQVKHAFTTRRKMMLKPLLQRHPEMAGERGQALEALLGQRRPEALTPEEHLEAFRLIAGILHRAENEKRCD